MEDDELMCQWVAQQVDHASAAILFIGYNVSIDWGTAGEINVVPCPRVLDVSTGSPCCRWGATERAARPVCIVAHFPCYAAGCRADLRVAGGGRQGGRGVHCASSRCLLACRMCVQLLAACLAGST